MRLILRVACSRSNPRRAEEARQLLRTTPVTPTSLIQRIALSKGDSHRAQAACELLKAMCEPPATSGDALPLIYRAVANDDGTAPIG